MKRSTNKRLYEETITTPEGRQQMSHYKRHVRRACMLAFVPPEDVIVDSWEQISAEYPEELDDFITYFERTWVGRRGRRRPLYDIHRWNQRERVLQGLMATNNNVEGFHNGFVSLVGYLNPTI